MQGIAHSPVSHRPYASTRYPQHEKEPPASPKVCSAEVLNHLESDELLCTDHPQSAGGIEYPASSFSFPMFSFVWSRSWSSLNIGACTCMLHLSFVCLFVLRPDVHRETHEQNKGSCKSSYATQSQVWYAVEKISFRL